MISSKLVHAMTSKNDFWVKAVNTAGFFKTAYLQNDGEKKNYMRWYIASVFMLDIFEVWKSSVRL